MKSDLRQKLRLAGIGLFIATALFAVYAPSIGYDFILLDDGEYIRNNPTLSGGFSWPAVKAAWTESKESYWAPLLWMSFMLDVELFGLEPWGFHLVNVALFALNAGLLFALFRRWTGRTGVALAATLLWALHPARVESVAWVVERKDVLSGLFFLLGLGAYVEGRQSRLPAGVGLAWLCMALGGAVKQILIVMPAVLMLLDVWPLARTDWDRIGRDGWRLAREKWTFWGLAAFLAFLPPWLHHQDGAMMDVPISHRLAMIPIHYLFYLKKSLWPSGLAVLQGDLPFRWPAFALGIGLLAGATWGLWRVRKAAPWALWGWAWFVGALFPLSGLVWAGAERLATRFLYVPHMGLALAVVLGLAHRGRNRRVIAAAAALLVLAVYLAATVRLLPYWRDSRTLFTRVLQVNPDSVHGFDNLARAYFDEGRFAEWQAYLEDFRARRSGSGIADIQYAWWQAAMLGDAETAWATLEKRMGLPRTDPDFWLWLETRTNDRMLLGTWRDVAGICLRTAGDLERLEQMWQHGENRWDERTRMNFLAEMLYAHWSAGREAEADALAREAGSLSGALLRAQMPARFAERWQQGARGYAFACFQNYARWVPGDGLALNNMAWLVATAKPDGLRHARMDEWPAAAVEWAEQALAASGGSIPAVWGTLAAARANAGDFAGAQAAADRALALAEAAGERSLAAKFQAQREEYRAGRPWRE
jgi:tetratricopeptide (TPR) repeat protein